MLSNNCRLVAVAAAGIELSQFAQDLQTWLQADAMVIVTDAIHRQRHEGVAFYGPAADQWPDMPPGTMLISSSQAQETAEDGLFGALFADAMAGRADKNRDRMVTTGELKEYLTKALEDTGQTPVFAGSYGVNQVLAVDVKETYGQTSGGENVVYPDYVVEKAKFVWQEGGSHTIKCREGELVTCDPLCYVREFKAGPCELSAVFDGTPLTGLAIVVGPGKYDCLRKGGELVCTGP